MNEFFFLHCISLSLLLKSSSTFYLLQGILVIIFIIKEITAPFIHRMSLFFIIVIVKNKTVFLYTARPHCHI